MRVSPSAAGISRWRGWPAVVLLPGAVVAFWPARAPAWTFMWALALALFASCKWLTWRRTAVVAPAWKHLAYLAAWPGMDAARFLGGERPSRPVPWEWVGATARMALGLLLVFGAARHVGPDDLAGWVGMVGLVLALHFGSLHLLSCAWRTVGVDAHPLMNRPLLSASLGEFWGRRWNTAFRDLTHRFLFRPLAARVGARAALAGGFAVSGIVHDLVISLPARGGYGGPTLFFLLQAAGMAVERSRWGRSMGLARGWPGRAFTFAVLVLPVCALFHPPFVRVIILPFLEALGAR